MLMMSPAAAAEWLDRPGLTAARIKARVKAGEFPFLMMGTHMMVDVDGIQRILAEEDRKRNLISTEELSKATGLTPSGIRRGVAEGWLPVADKVGRHMRFDLEQVRDALHRIMLDNMTRR